MTNKRLVTKLHSIGPATSKLFLFCEFISGSPEKAHFTLYDSRSQDHTGKYNNRREILLSTIADYKITQENIIIEGKLG